jgi:hypothetical protein
MTGESLKLQECYYKQCCYKGSHSVKPSAQIKTFDILKNLWIRGLIKDSQTGFSRVKVKLLSPASLSKGGVETSRLELSIWVFIQKLGRHQSEQAR